jgi:hypothetical protein
MMTKTVATTTMVGDDDGDGGDDGDDGDDGDVATMVMWRRRW